MKVKRESEDGDAMNAENGEERREREASVRVVGEERRRGSITTFYVRLKSEGAIGID
jgi:hypothetical protein